MHDSLNQVINTRQRFNFPQIFTLDDHESKSTCESFILTYRSSKVGFDKYLLGMVKEAAFGYFQLKVSCIEIGTEWEGQKYTFVWRIQNLGRISEPMKTNGIRCPFSGAYLALSLIHI